MHRILIIDDDRIIRRGLAKIIPWEQYGFQLVGEAADGEQGLNLIEAEYPTIVISDIKMPFMDGLELAQIVKERYPLIKLILLTGYTDFSYAQQAVKAHVFDYLLKPVDKENLLEKVRNAASEWDAENRVQQKINAANPFFRREFLKKLMEGNGEETELRQDAMSLGIDLTGQTFIAFLIKIDEYHQDSMKMADFVERQKAFKFCVVNMCEEVTHSQRTGGVVELEQDELVLLYSSNETVQVAEKNGRYLVEQIQKLVHKYLKTTVTIVFGGVHQGILGLRLSYQESRSLLDFRHFIGKDKIYSLSDIKLSSQQDMSLQTEDKVNELVQKVKLGLAQDAFLVIDDLEQVMIQEKQMSLYHVRLLSVWLVISLFRGSAEWASDWEHVQRKNMSLYYIRINEMQTISEILTLIRSVVGDLAEFMAGKRESHRGGVIGEAVKYMEKHYVKQGLSLQDVASHIHINPVYLSTLFKQEKKITFSDFLLQVRMQKAMELLRNQDMKCYEVADMVGYNTPEYFSVCFKKHTGLSPIEFKNRL